jgi:hypothetical protein
MNEFPSDSYNQPGQKRRATEALVSGSSKVHSCFNAASSSKHNTTVPQTPPATRKRTAADENTPPRPPRTVPTPCDHPAVRTTLGAWQKSPAADILADTDEDDELPAMVADTKVRPQHITHTPCCVSTPLLRHADAVSAGKEKPFRLGSRARVLSQHMRKDRGSFLSI